MYDTIIIGGGPGGYLAAERLGHFEKKVLLIEENYLGGTCLNVGCIPTKTLINSAKQYAHAQDARKFGITIPEVAFDWGAIQSWKNEVVDKLKSGVAAQMKRFSVEVMDGRGEIAAAPSGTAPGKVRVTAPDGSVSEAEGRTILIAAGSAPVMPPIPGTAGNPLVMDSSALLSIKSVPEKLVIIGGGVIGVEFASLFSALGSQVTVIEMMDDIIPFMDREQTPLLRRAMRKVDFKLGCKVEKIENSTVHFTGKDGTPGTADGDAILMAVGRKPVITGWGAENAGVSAGPKGVTVDEFMRTGAEGIWAAGDVTGRSLLAHTAYRMAEVAVTDIVRFLDSNSGLQPDAMNYAAIPWAVYGLTEAAGIGMTEQDAEKQGITVRKASVPMRFSGRFAAENTFAGQGAVKVIADAKTEKIIGIHAVGAYASEFIWGGAPIIEGGLTISGVKKFIFPHPTVCELIRDALWELPG
ncbi:dihydrolipoyl dehydrogenase [Breznakiella homolactica]|uniref:Dihydrolipoyl dehydrogenase n=1 Tax=Breznakiella homolactica TaxID=2798577 RepID=A0A7T7XMS5_9SPIR|nr:dihydrolipoyl dehydrogenase [Breznakiella homolactica]QQO09224.1 dihydrolipoyl dehydrogenase [Breznakiella homolactica]